VSGKFGLESRVAEASLRSYSCRVMAKRWLASNCRPCITRQKNSRGERLEAFCGRGFRRLCSLQRTLSTEQRRTEEHPRLVSKSELSLFSNNRGRCGLMGSRNPSMPTQIEFDGEGSSHSPVRQNHQAKARAHTAEARGQSAKVYVTLSGHSQLALVRPICAQRQWPQKRAELVALFMPIAKPEESV
jgi:hypothetical protein